MVAIDFTAYSIATDLAVGILHPKPYTFQIENAMCLSPDLVLSAGIYDA